MVACRDLPPIELNRIEVADMGGRTIVHRQAEHLVEVTVVEGAVPTHGDGVAAHDASGGSGIEGVGQSLHILIVVAALQEKLKKSADRHVGDRVEAIELDAMARSEFFSKLRFDGLLLGREKGSDRITDEIQRQSTAGPSIAELVEEAKRLDRFLENALAPLRIGLAGAVIGQRRDDFHTMPGEELCQVRLRGEEQDRQITAVHHVATQCPALFDQPAEVGVELWCPARDIDRRNIGLSERADTLLRRFAGHALGAIRACIDVTMSACLIAELTDIDLKDGDPGGVKREQAYAIELRLEGGTTRGPPEYLQLLR